MKRLFLAVHACVLALAVALFVWAAAPAHGETSDQSEGTVAEEPTPGSAIPSEGEGEGYAEIPGDPVVVSDEEAQREDATGVQGDSEEAEAQPIDESMTAEDAVAPEDVPAESEDVPAESEDLSVAPEVIAEEDVSEQKPDLSTQAVADATSAEQKALDAYAAKHANDIVAGRYRIANALSTKLSLCVSSTSKSDGSKVFIWKNKKAANQRWDLISVGGGYMAIRNASSGKYLDISGSDSAAKSGSPVVQWSERDESSRSQRWIVVRTSKGYRLISGVAQKKGERLVLSLSGGKAVKGAAAVLAVEKNEKASEQLWNFSVPKDALDAFAAQHKGDLANGLYVVGSKLSYTSGKQLALSVKGASKVKGTSIVVMGRKVGSPKYHDVWSVRHTAKGYVIIKNLYTGEVLNVTGGTAADDAPVVQFTDKKGKMRRQLWVATKEADGSYKLVSALAGDVYLTLQVRGSKATSKTKTVLATSTVRKSQNWTFDKAPSRFSAISSLNGKTFLLGSSLDLTKALGAYKSRKKAGTHAVIGTATGASSQRWKVTYDSKGYAHLINENSGLELGVNDAGTVIEAAGTFKWLIEASSGKTYTLTAKTGSFSGKLLTVKGANTADNTNVVVQANASNASQRWSFLDMKSGLDGVDISGWNTDIKYSKLGSFVIVKATEWNPDKKSYTSYNNYQDKADKALAAGKLIGFYHFATNPNTSKQSMAKQAEGFIKAVSVKDSSGKYKYLGQAVLFLDWEDTSYSTVETTKGVTWAKQWLDYVYKKTGIKPIIYMNKNCTNAHNWSKVANAGYALWGAQYLNKYYNENLSQMITSFVASPTLTDGWGAWGTPLIYQYTATARLHGNKMYDVNKFYGTKADWLRLAAAK